MEEKDVKQIPDEEKKLGHVLKPYQGIIAAIILIIVVGLLIFFFFSHFKGVFVQIGLVLEALQAVVIGVVIAYIMCPVMNSIERRLMPVMVKRITPSGEEENNVSVMRKRRRVRSISIAITLLLLIAILALLGTIIIPEVISSITNFIVALPANVEKLTAWLQELSDKENAIAEYTLTGLNQLLDYIEKYFNNDFQDQLGGLVKSVTTGVISVGRFIFNFIIGFIVAVYVLFDKEKFLAQSKKLVCTIFQPKAANAIFETARETHEIFIGFIVGKIIDSIIIGFLTYIILVCFSMPYALLVSVIVGTTNIIPFFGPFIGAIPSFFLILLADPIKGLIFILIILAIQQIDGNIIGPKILGETTGLSTFWVIVAILFSGGLFGFTGMVLGVPLFAAISNIIRKVMDYFLKKKDMPTESYKYEALQSVDPATGDFCYEKRDTNRPKPWHFRKRRDYDKAIEEEILDKVEEERKKHKG